VPESKTKADSQSAKDYDDKRQREKLKAAYLEMKKDPNTDPAKLAKLKKLLSSTMGSDTLAPKADGDALARSSNRMPEGTKGSAQDNKDLLIAQYMHLKGDPNSDAAELKRLKSEIASLQAPKEPIPVQNKMQSSDPTLAQDRNQMKKPDASPQPTDTSARSSNDDKEQQQRRQLKELYQKLKADPNADPRKLEKVKMAILKIGQGEGKSTSAGAKDVRTSM